MSLGRLWTTKVVFQAVASKEKFADVTTDVVSDQEFSTWVLVVKLHDVKDEIIKNNEFPTICDMLIKLLLGHGCLGHFQWDFSAQVDLVSDLKHDQKDEEKRS